jgi:hypothetical protein
VTAAFAIHDNFTEGLIKLVAHVMLTVARRGVSG